MKSVCFVCKKCKKFVLLLVVAKTIQFGRDMVNNCPELAVKTTVAPIPDFKPHHLYGTEDLTVFTLEIGQAGSTQGYLALTGQFVLYRMQY